MRSIIPYRWPLLAGTILLLVCGVQDSAAEDTSQQIWVDYNPSWMISKKVTFGGDVGYRTQLESDGWDRLALRPGVDIPFRHVTLKGGIGNFWTFSENIQNRWEIRPYQGVGWVWPRSKVNFDHLVRLEERFDINTVTWTSLNSLRGRYRLRARYKFAEVRPDRFWRAFGSGEFYVKLAGTEGLQQEQFRITFGLERSFSHLQRFRLQLTWQQQDVTLLPSESADEIYIRLRFYQNF